MRFIAAVAAVASATMLCVAGPTVVSAAQAPCGTVLAWGSNSHGQLGDHGSTDSPVPVAADLPAGTTVTAVAAGDGFSLAATSAGTILAWGDNSWGQLGNGSTSTTPVLTPARVVGLPSGTYVTAIAAGGRQSLALTSSGAVWAWGNNGFGQLGDGRTTDSDRPVAVRLPRGTVATAIAAGGDHSLAVTSGGRVWAWGYNKFGQLGNGGTTNSPVPVAVRLPAGTVATAVAAGAFHSLAVTSGGGVWAWGDNAKGQLGNGGTTNSPVPVTVSLAAGTYVTAVAGGALHSLALTSDRRVLAWGYNHYGQLGDGSTTESDSPVAANPPAGTVVTGLSASSVGYHNLALAEPAASTTTVTPR